MNHFISKTLGIEDPNIFFENNIEEIELKGQKCKYFYAKVSYTPDYCESCGALNTNHTVVKNGFKNSRITIPKVSEMNAFLVLKKQRFYCKNCCSYFTAQTNIVDVDCHISKNTRLTILDKATSIRSQKSIAKSCGVSNSTVSRIINHAVQSIKHLPFASLPKHILMDEFKSVNRPLYNKYKRYWKLLLTPFEDLNAVSYRKLKLFKSWQTPKGVVEYLLSFDTEFQYSYEIVNELRYSLKQNNSTDFITTLNEIDTNKVCFKLKIALKTLKKYQLYIDNTLKCPNITNGSIEGINNKIKLIKRISFGYRNYDNLRNRILLTSRLYASSTKKEIKQPKVD